MKSLRGKVFDGGGLAVGLATAIAVFGAVVAENINIDPNTVMGGGGLTLGGFLLHAVMKYLKQHEKLQELQEQLIKKQLEIISEEQDHRESEKSHWRLVETRLEWQGRALERLDTGRYTPIPQDLPPGVPR